MNDKNDQARAEEQKMKGQRLQGNMQADSTMLTTGQQQGQEMTKPGTTNPLYVRVGEAEAEAVAWVWEGPDKIERYFYRFPPLGPKEVRIRLLYSGVCKIDVEKAQSCLGKSCYPFCGGEEAVGEIVALGKEANKFKMNDKVAVGAIRDACMSCDMCKLGETSLCMKLPEVEKENTNGKYFGTFSTHIQQPESHVFKIPDGLKLQTVAPLMNAGIAVYRPLIKHGKKGMTVGMVGIGALGHLAIKFARAMGMHVDAIINNECLDKYHDILNLGVEKILRYDSEHCMELCQNHYDIIMYMLPVNLPVEEMNKIMLTLKPMGKLILIGTPKRDDNFQVSFMPVVSRDIQIIGTFIGGQKDTENMLKFARSNGIESECEFFEFDDFPKAVERVAKAHPKFSAVLKIDQTSRRFIR
jgi:uncharacterized zinc-type alcohol dehydrogenase-like protein